MRYQVLVVNLKVRYTVVYFAKEANSNLAKAPLNFNGGLAKLGLTVLVK